jgi:TonB family protein
MPDNPEKSANVRPEKDRRLHARQRVHSLSYVKMGDSNGGIVLNISEGGISVQAAAVLDPTEPVTMWLEIPKVRDRVEVTAEIAWLSASKKEAGLRFVDLPDSTLQQIRKWMAREASPEQFEDESEPVGEEQDSPGETVEVALEDEAGVRELTEKNIMSAEEIKSLESARHSVEVPEMGETEEGEEEGEDEAIAEVKSHAAGTAEIDADSEDDSEDGEDFDEESESEPGAETEEEVELVAKASAEEKRETEVEIKSEAADDRSLEEESAAEVAAEAGARVDVKDDAEEEGEDEAEAEEELQTEDELIRAFGPPVVPFERRPHAPFSSMSALAGGSRSSQNLAIAAALPREVHKSAKETVAQPDIAPDIAPNSGWNVFTVQLQTGWFLAALVLLLALISFIAGMAVRRGALNNVLGEQQDALAPKSSGAAAAGAHATLSTGGGAVDGSIGAAAKPLSIEIVDAGNHRWAIPASSGTNHAITAPVVDTAGSVAASPASVRAKGGEAEQQAQGSSGPAASANGDGAAPANAGKPVVPLVLSLPETPISASGSVAISSQRSVPVPADGSKAAQNAKNLQVGQLINLVEPVYPAEAVQQKIEGTVKVHAVIGTDGVIESVAQVSGPQLLVNASVNAVRNWKYSPTRMNGQAIETQEDISFVFRLPN